MSTEFFCKHTHTHSYRCMKTVTANAVPRDCKIKRIVRNMHLWCAANFRLKDHFVHLQSKQLKQNIAKGSGNQGFNEDNSWKLAESCNERIQITRILCFLRVFAHFLPSQVFQVQTLQWCTHFLDTAICKFLLWFHFADNLWLAVHIGWWALEKEKPSTTIPHQAAKKTMLNSLKTTTITILDIVHYILCIVQIL